MSRFPASLFLCFSVSLLLCFPASLFLCFSASLLLCFSASLLLCFPASLFLCFSASLLLCFSASRFLCFSASLPYCFPNRYTNPYWNPKLLCRDEPNPVATSSPASRRLRLGLMLASPMIAPLRA